MIKKRILIFSTAYFPLVGGAEVAVKEITDRLPEFEFVMITARIKPEFPEVEQIGNIQVHRIGLGNQWDKFRLILNGSKKAKELGKFDAVWSIMASYAGFAALRFKKKNKQVPFLLTLQEGDSRFQIYKHVWWCWWYFKHIFKKADKIQAISSYLARWARQLGANAETIVVPNGVDVQKFAFNNSQSGARNELLNKLNIPPQAKIVCTISRLVKKNGVGPLIKSLQYLNPSVHLLILGSGELEQNLKALALKLGLSGRVHFLGNTPHNVLPQYLAVSSVFCRPSLSEGLGVAFLEAMAAGVPVVAPAIGGIPDFLLDGETGLFCKVNNPKDIAEKIERVLNDEMLGTRLRETGRKLVELKYTWESVTRQMKNIFEKL